MYPCDRLGKPCHRRKLDKYVSVVSDIEAEAYVNSTRFKALSNENWKNLFTQLPYKKINS